MACPLCNEKRFVNIKDYNCEELVKQYKAAFSVDVSGYFDGIKQLSLRQCVNCYLKYFPDGKEGNANFYATLSKQPWYYMKEKFEYDYAMNKIVEYKPSSILDVGCGEGFFLEHFKDSFEVRGSEHNPDAIRVLNSKGIKLDDDSMKYDFIVCFQVLEHVKNVKEFLDWIYGKLNANGYLFIAVPNPDSEYIKEVPQLLNFPPHHVNWISKSTLYKISELYDMNVIDYIEEPMEDIHMPSFLNIRKQKLSNNSIPRHPILMGIWNAFFSRMRASIEDGVRAGFYPLIKDYLKFRGHTHGILLKKS